MPLILIALGLMVVNILETVWLKLRHREQAPRTSRMAALIIGISAGILGAEHGYYEILQRDRALNGILFDAVSGTSFSFPPTTEMTGLPAMTLIPNFLITGILAVLVSLVVIGWAAIFLQRKNGGLTLILLSILMLLVGGGFVPPLFGIIAAVIGRYRASE